MWKTIILAALILALSASMAGAVTWNGNLTITADNIYWAYIAGATGIVGSDAYSGSFNAGTNLSVGYRGGSLATNMGTGSPPNWWTPQTNIAVNLDTTKTNYLYVLGANWLGSSWPNTKDNPAGILAKLSGDGGSIVTNGTWQWGYKDIIASDGTINTASSINNTPWQTIGNTPGSLNVSHASSPWNGVGTWSSGAGALALDPKANWIWNRNWSTPPPNPKLEWKDLTNDQNIWFRTEIKFTANDKLQSNVVPEASTLVGFGSAIAMAGPGMIGWLRRRRA